MDINVIYNMNIKELKKYVMDNINNPDIILLFKDSRIKKKILLADFNDFFDFFLDGVPFNILSTLFDNDGIEIFNEYSNDRVFKVQAIFKIYSDEPNLFKNNIFCDLACIYCTFGVLSRISAEAAGNIIEYAIKAENGYLITLLQSLGDIQVEAIKGIEIPYDKLFYVIGIGTKETVQYLLSYDSRINSLLNFSFIKLYNLAYNGVTFPKHLFYEDRFVRWVVSIKNVKLYRLFVNLLSRNNDTSYIEQIRKEYYENEINRYDEKIDMLARYSECYRLVTSKDFKIKDDEELNDILMSLFDYEDNTKYTINLLREISYCILKKKFKQLRKLLRDESHFQLTNMIIDYYFEDITYNVFLDIRELINFNAECSVITKEDALRYRKIFNLDNLPYPEARELFEEMKNYHYSQFYDVIRNAKDKAIDLIEQVMLNEETIQKYRDKELSEQHGVDVYVLDGDDYYALIRSFCIYKDTIIEHLNSNRVDGNSFTLDYSMKRDTYCSPKTCYNMIYSCFPKDQIVHIFSVDSYSKYRRGSYEETTARVYEIRTPEELVRVSLNYNEIVMSVPNSNKNDELNSNLRTPKIMGIYCFDKITPEDALSAKNLGIGIVMVRTAKYNVSFKPLDNKMNKAYRDLYCGENTSEFDYIRDLKQDDMEHRKSLCLKKN